jgi:two-component system, chemotaxis family, protein-glutamate methylesterase/glutaminase
MINVLVVEDSPVVREYLVHILSSDPDIRVVGTAGDGEEAMEFVKDRRPDVITMDIHMPRMDGFEATRRIMETVPTPIIIVSGSTNRSEVVLSLQAIEAGALTFIARPAGLGSPAYEDDARSFVQTVKLMSEIKMVRRWGGASKGRERSINGEIAEEITADAKVPHAEIKIIAIGASTGGPMVIKSLLEMLPERMPVPMLIVQHIAHGFIQGFTDWLNLSASVPVRIAAQGEAAAPGCAYVSPDDVHMGITPEGRILLATGEPEHGLRPSVSHLFRSVADAYGANAAGILLTGMGRDGSEELLSIRKRGGVTFVQDEASSVVNGMPGEAVKMGAADFILPPESIARMLMKMLHV